MNLNQQIRDVQIKKIIQGTTQIELVKTALNSQQYNCEEEVNNLVIENAQWNSNSVKTCDEFAISVYSNAEKDYSWEITSEIDSKLEVCSFGSVYWRTGNITESDKLNDLREHCSRKIDITKYSDRLSSIFTKAVDNIWTISEDNPLGKFMLVQFNRPKLNKYTDQEIAVANAKILAVSIEIALEFYSGCKEICGLQTIKNIDNFLDNNMLYSWSLIHMPGQPEGDKETLNIELFNDLGICVSKIEGIMVNSKDSEPNDARDRNERVWMNGWSLKECVLWDVKEAVAQVLNIVRDKIDIEENLEKFGFNSINLVEFSGILNELYNLEITADIFYSYPTIDDLCNYIITESPDNIEAYYQNDKVKEEQKKEDISVPGNSATSDLTAGDYDRISIIGMSGKFPDANSISELWDIIKEGCEVIHEVPKSRKEWWENGSEELNSSRKMGVIQGIDEFDPRFFEILPVEAELMDPRQRLILEEAWKALEDAGYGNSELQKEKIGMFVGVEEGDYSTLVGKNKGITSNSNAILAARISYFLNLTGPNIAINTACSSGLVALHEACLSLRNYECDTAIVAAANILTLPDSYDTMKHAGMISVNGKCCAFDKMADGMVPAESVAVIVLRRFNDAVKAKNIIYANIIGSGINYDGKTNGIAAPSGQSQEHLIREIYNRYNIDSQDISYIVTHGTGTKLGDPIEVNALSNVFGKGKGHCALTSIKSNIGHCQAASGLVNLISLVCSMKEELIPPTINCKNINELIHLEKSAFYFNRELKEWKNPEKGKKIGAISSFGFSGTNAHAVLESFSTIRDDIDLLNKQSTYPVYIFTFSGKTEGAVKRQMENILRMLEQFCGFTAGFLKSISYTLMTSRIHFKHRYAVIASTYEEFVQILQNACNGSEDNPSIYSGIVERGFKEKAAISKSVQELVNDCQNGEIDNFKYRENISAMAEFYCLGYQNALCKLWENNEPYKVHLPTYSFEKERYWFEQSKLELDSKLSSKLHPLVHENISNIETQRYHTAFTGEEFYIKSHVIKGEKVLPGAAFLEIARAAVANSLKGTKRENAPICLNNIVFRQPLKMDGNKKDVYIDVLPNEKGYEFHIFSLQEGDYSDKILHSQGFAKISNKITDKNLELSTYFQKCSNRYDDKAFYSFYESIGMIYGEEQQSVKELWVGDKCLIAKLVLPGSIINTIGQYVLHPSLLDGAFQSTIGYSLDSSTQVFVPFSIDAVTIYNNFKKSMYVIINKSESKNINQFNIMLCGLNGEICACINGFTSREMKDVMNVSTGAGVLLKPQWKEEYLLEKDSSFNYGYRELVCLNGLFSSLEEIKERGYKGLDRYCNIKAAGRNLGEFYKEFVEKVFVEIQRAMTKKNSGPILFQVVIPADFTLSICSGIAGMLKTAHQENPLFIPQTITMDNSYDKKNYLDFLLYEASFGTSPDIRIRDGHREVLDWEKLELADETSMPWHNGGVYLISGGLGGLGKRFAHEILRRTKDAKIILIGRSCLVSENKELVEEFNNYGYVEYHQTDVCDEERVHKVVDQIVQKFGTINGVIHCAGVISDNFIIKKSKDEIQNVISVKVDGAINLDNATKDMNLDFMVFFSSVAGSLGNSGQSDYAAGNGFLDSYAQYRTLLVEQDQRKGITLSINWPLWEDGGMNVDDITSDAIEKRSGLSHLPAEIGIQKFYQAFHQTSPNVMCFYAKEPSRLEHFIEDLRNKKERGESRVEGNTKNDVGLNIGKMEEKVSEMVIDIMSLALKIPREWVEQDTPFEELGIDSIMVMLLTDELDKIFGNVPKTLFFEYQTVRELSFFLCSSYQSVLKDKFLFDVEKVEGRDDEDIITKEHLLHNNQDTDEPEAGIERRDIAIVGLSAKFPKAHNIEAFWENLKSGIDCITEIPANRWDSEKYYDPVVGEPGKSYSKWGGFLDTIDAFDPMFFNISPKEAELMDPQERLFLECAYEVIEDAGYPKNKLGFDLKTGSYGNVGVFVGAMYSEYQFYSNPNNNQSVNVSLSSIANRVSYYMNFNGPSIAVDTMCSSSLTAVHLACEALLNGTCKAAIAGGVNVSIHPNKYLILSQGHFASSNGRCESFGEGGDGYVPSEGVGAVLLKPLNEAIRDRDNIYGIIKGSSINHGGKTNGYSVPNPNAQKNVILNALMNSNINPEDISYVEAHGTGTKLGDPIEITGLSQAFGKFTPKKQYCALGSVKSNIGHCESAAGIAGLTKVLLQMRYGYLVPTLHAETLNPFIDFTQTPFVVQRQLSKWPRRSISEDEGNKELPKLAAISSFGAGGSNAHIIVQEHLDINKNSVLRNDRDFIILLSAKTMEQLYGRANQLLKYLDCNNEFYKEFKLGDIAYTLQVGREPMTCRLGIVVSTISELKERLNSFINNQENIENTYVSSIEKKANLTSLLSDEDMIEAVKSWIAKGKYKKLLDLWMKGFNLDWEILYENNTEFKRVSLPTYPFSREHYWVGNSDLIDNAIGLDERVIEEIKENIEQVLRIPVDNISHNESFHDLGFDSISLVEFAGLLSDYYGIEVKPDVFFSYPNIEQIKGYLIHNFNDKIVSQDSDKYKNNAKPFGLKNNKAENIYEPISIVGLSGCFPGANNIDELWDIFLEGKEAISEFSFDKKRWLGALENKEAFDPLFFEISPLEAEGMDPRQRLLLQETWLALEDAAYLCDSFKSDNVGMFVGIEEGDTICLEQGSSNITAKSNAILAARLAYFLDFHGPNMAINTACSSGLVALYEACMSIWNGECDTAIVAGINLFNSFDVYDAMEKAGMLSSDGKCYAFDQRANGMVPAEALAVIVIRRESLAKADKQHIYANIVGGGINYDGKTNGITAPNGQAQTQLYNDVYKKFAVERERLSYIVTHGTGTRLGDPVEINALTNAFKEITSDKPFCALTSTKPNLGHSQAASGLVSLICLVLAMNKEIIPPSINCEKLNDYIKWNDSPFYINTEAREWKEEQGYKRLGAVNSFGFSGTNAHIVVESAGTEKDEELQVIEQSGYPSYLLAFSGATQTALKNEINTILEHLKKKGSNQEGYLSSVSYTLLAGRKHFKHRSAIIVKDIDDAIKTLEMVKNDDYTAKVFKGEVPGNFSADSEKINSVKYLMNECLNNNGNEEDYTELLYQLAKRYCLGYDREIRNLWGDNTPFFVRLPGYTFDQIIFEKQPLINSENVVKRFTASKYGELIHENISDLMTQKYRTILSGKEFFLTDHLIGGKKTLPGVAYLEMAYSAIRDASKNEEDNLAIMNVAWFTPIEVMDDPIEIRISIYPEQDGKISFEIHTGVFENEILHYAGAAEFIEKTQAAQLELPALGSGLETVVGKSDFYKLYRQRNMIYGYSHQSVQELRIGDNALVVKLELPKNIEGTNNEFTLHPSIMDGAFQATLALALTDNNVTYLPFSAENVLVRRKCEADMFAYIKSYETNGLKKYNIMICDPKGEICIEIGGYTSRALNKEAGENG